MVMDSGRKRGNSDGAFGGNGGVKKAKQEMESFATGIGGKSKSCMKFFRQMIRTRNCI
ncbi:hypothetical protein NMG60_11002691 [Bertholletia excelsa]